MTELFVQSSDYRYESDQKSRLQWIDKCSKIHNPGRGEDKRALARRKQHVGYARNRARPHPQSVLHLLIFFIFGLLVASRKSTQRNLSKEPKKKRKSTKKKSKSQKKRKAEDDDEYQPPPAKKSKTGSKLKLPVSDGAILLRLRLRPNYPWRQYLRACLLQFMHRDILPIILAYADFIQLNCAREWGTRGPGDGELMKPNALCVHQNNLYINDRWNRRIQVYEQATGRFLHQWKHEGSLVAALAADRDKLYAAVDVTLVQLSQVEVFSLIDHTLKSKFTMPDPTRGLCLAGNELFISTCRSPLMADNDEDVLAVYGEQAITVMTTDEKRLTRKLGAKTADLTCPGKLAVQDRDLFIINNDTVVSIDIVTGAVIRRYTWERSRHARRGVKYAPTAVCIHGDEVILCDGFNDNIIIIRRQTGDELREFGCGSRGPGGGPNAFDNPQDMCVNAKGDLFVCDTNNARVKVFQ